MRAAIRNYVVFDPIAVMHLGERTVVIDSRAVTDLTDTDGLGGAE